LDLEKSDLASQKAENSAAVWFKGSIFTSFVACEKEEDNYDELYGGPDECENEDDPFCFVTEDSNCDDIEYSSVNERFENIWSIGKEIHYSYEACYAIQDDRTGNEEILNGVRIISDFLLDKEKIGLPPIKFASIRAEYVNQCKYQCERRYLWMHT